MSFVLHDLTLAGKRRLIRAGYTRCLPAGC
jgi:hypothetical protein